jgi:hypothetical protein
MEREVNGRMRALLDFLKGYFLWLRMLVMLRIGMRTIRW